MTPNVYYCPHCRSLRSREPDTPCARCEGAMSEINVGMVKAIANVFGMEAAVIVPWSDRPVKI